uniref:Uncharacterized protein n=1 Tax=Oryza glumipatula TaxID=40148 RepID=A0A0E0BNH4_9ORYZ
MMPLWTTKNSSPAPEDWGWLFLGAGTPCVAHLVWAIPACTLKAASRLDGMDAWSNPSQSSKGLGLVSKGQRGRSSSFFSCLTHSP